MRLTLTRHVAIAPLVGVTLLLAACSGGSGSAQAEPGGAACLEGDWTADVPGQQAALQEQAAASPGELTIELSGGVVTSFSGGRITTSYDNQLLVIGAAFEGQTIRSVTTLNGSTTGTFTATDTDVTIAITDANGLEVTMGNYKGDVLADDRMAGYEEAMLQAVETTATATYTCSGDTLTIKVPEANIGVGLGSAVETVMHRR